jgi:hypothetical protein
MSVTSIQNHEALSSKHYVIVTFLCVTIDGFRIREWIYGPLVHTTRNYNYSATADFHTLQITIRYVFSQPCVSNGRSLATASNTGHSSVCCDNVGEYLITELTQSAWVPCYIPSGRTQQKTPPPTVFLLLLWAVA